MSFALVICMAFIGLAVVYVMARTPSSSSGDDAYYKDRDSL